MSVINQMLRDLDQRGQGLEGTSTPGVRSVANAPLPPVSRRGHGGRKGEWLLLTVLLVVAAAAWYSDAFDFRWPGFAAPQPIAQPAAVAAPAASTPVPVNSGPNPAPLPELASLTTMPGAPVQLRLDAELEHVPLVTPPPTTRGSAVSVAPTAVVATSAPRPNPAPTPQAEVRPPPPKPTTERSQPISPPAAAQLPANEGASTGPRQLAAAREALAQAQALWSQGNQGTAYDLLRDALSLADRQITVAGMDSVVLSMVRELARMQLALGRVQEAYDMLVAHEGRTRQVAEIWALRGNAAQRLGLHADSVQAYMQALQTRPNEQRWLLGLAVSLAAMGQTQAANDVVERARAEGPIARDIANYLRQMGVTVR